MSFSRATTTIARPLLRTTVARTPRFAPLPFNSFLYPTSSLRDPSRFFSSTPRQFEAPPTLKVGGTTPIGRIDRRLKIVFTCTASVPLDPQHPHPGSPARPCGKRSSHEFSKRSYEKGVVIVQCPECSNRHLIADHLQWFSQTPSPEHPKGQPIGSETPRTIEDLMREKGEQVRWIDEGDEGATLEVDPEQIEDAKK